MAGVAACVAGSVVLVANGMKQYVFDELRRGDQQKLKAYLDEKFQEPPIDGIYWLKIPVRHLSSTQCQHEACQPFYFALELRQGALWVELLLRSKTRIRCDCITYASADQQRWLVDRIYAMLAAMEIQN